MIRPRRPTANTEIGWCIGSWWSMCMSVCTASTTKEKLRDAKNTQPPSIMTTSTRAHPNVFFSFFSRWGCVHCKYNGHGWERPGTRNRCSDRINKRKKKIMIFTLDSDRWPDLEVANADVGDTISALMIFSTQPAFKHRSSRSLRCKHQSKNHDATVNQTAYFAYKQ